MEMKRRDFFKIVVLAPLAGVIIPVSALELKNRITMDKFNVVMKLFRKDRGGGEYLLTAMGTNQYLGVTMISHREYWLAWPLLPEASHCRVRDPEKDYWADHIDVSGEARQIKLLEKDIRKKFSKILEARKV